MKLKQLLVALALTSLATSQQACAQQTKYQDGFHHDENIQAIPPSTVINPYVPTEMTFAGVKVDLRRADLRERLDRELITFTYGHTNTLLMIKRANRYFPIIEPILKECGVPDDLKYLMAIESSVDIRALSTAKAAGLWQFMQATGKEYGLEVNANVDERYHVEKATRAACKYLKDGYEKYGDWLTVAASYNAGFARITSELANQKSSTSMDMWLNKETSRYMFRILAAKQVFSSPRLYGFILRASDLYPTLPTQPYEVKTTITDLGAFAKGQGVPMSLLKEANPWLISNTLPVRPGGKTYVIQIPLMDGWSYDPASTLPHDPNWVTE
ncbi:MAG: lytic transglycosylase domain-containing protein [Bacteroidaceae bacterium]|nr:lytic transglycosylase domain-containing protein [Bacteroidaceae bacterium]